MLVVKNGEAVIKNLHVICYKLAKSVLLILSKIVRHEGAGAFWPSLWPHVPGDPLPKNHGEQLSDLEGLWSGRSCYIVGSGPSAADFKLEGVDFAFYLNKAIGLHVCGVQVPCAQVVSDPKAYEEMLDEGLLGRGELLFIAAGCWKSFPLDHRALLFRIWRRPFVYDGFFQRDLSRPLYQAHSVFFFALQIAVGMGFKKIYLAGIDFDFSEKDPHFYKSSAGELKRAGRSRLCASKMLQGLRVASMLLKEREGVEIYSNSRVPGMKFLSPISKN